MHMFFSISVLVILFMLFFGIRSIVFFAVMLLLLYCMFEVVEKIVSFIMLVLGVLFVMWLFRFIRSL